MSKKDKTALIHRWPSDFVERLKVVAEDNLMPVQTYVFQAVRREMERDARRMQREQQEFETLEAR
jgi:hypothetical protein